MRGSVYYQTSQLTKVIFCEGLKKKEKIDPTNVNFNKVSSYKSMESYRNIWNNFFNYLREHWKLKDPILISSIHISAYMEYKIEYYPSKLYLSKICSALGKLETALHLYSIENFKKPINYDFSIRLKILKKTRDLKNVADNYHDRAYDNPLELISNLSSTKHRLAAAIQYEGGARYEGVGLIKKEQLLGYKIDKITNSTTGVILTKEKGGKEGEVMVSRSTYKKLKKYIDENSKFSIKRAHYAKDIRDTCDRLGIIADGSHGLRWNFAQRRIFEYGKASYAYEQALLGVSSEMKHNRASITQHYTG